MEQRKIITGFWTEPDYRDTPEEIENFKPKWIERTREVPRLDMTELNKSKRELLPCTFLCTKDWKSSFIPPKEVDIVCDGKTAWTASMTYAYEGGELVIRLKGIEPTPEHRPRPDKPTYAPTTITS